LGGSTADAGRARACPDEEDFLHALDSRADMVPVRRSVLALGPEQQARAWRPYAAHLETQLDLVYDQLAAAARRRAVHAPLRAESDLVLLARVRAEQLMSLRLLNLLAACAPLEVLADAGGDAAAVLDVHRRRQLRARDFEESLAEQQALRQAARAQACRSRESAGAQQLRLPPYWPESTRSAG
jgi:hypothetical protein